MTEWHQRANDIIKSQAKTLAHSIMARHFELRPNLAEIYGEQQKEIYVRDTKYNLEALAASILLPLRASWISGADARRRR